jgi:hypothetical protein
MQTITQKQPTTLSLAGLAETEAKTQSAHAPMNLSHQKGPFAAAPEDN